MILYMNPLDRVFFKGHERLCVTPTDLAYAAGVIDGEGCLGIYPRKSRRDGVYTSIIKVEMCETECLDFLQELFGGHRTAHRPKAYPKHRILHQWAVSATLASDCAELILPYLRIKRKQAENIIAIHLITKQIRANTSLQRKTRNGFMGDKGQFALDPVLASSGREIYLAQRLLNARGDVSQEVAA